MTTTDEDRKIAREEYFDVGDCNTDEFYEHVANAVAMGRQKGYSDGVTDGLMIGLGVNEGDPAITKARNAIEYLATYRENRACHLAVHVAEQDALRAEYAPEEVRRFMVDAIDARKP